ncbi:MAG: transketolase C-terminal domain-containing protein, partial [Nitrospiria bacterium]
MLMQIEGSQAVAKAVVLCRPEVISCYPITPQTHIVETLSALVKKGEVGSCQFLNAESEFGALSILIGASAAGARTYTATGSQGLLFMAEAVYNVSGLGFPIVMTIGNRTIGAPINIWNDHSDSMSMRDSGWIQLYAENNQEALDLHIQAFRLAEELSCPVMVCMDGFILTHAFERVDLPDQHQVDSFLPPYEPIQVLDPGDPISIGAMVGPDAFMEVKYLAHQKQIRALELILQIQDEFKRNFSRSSGGLFADYLLTDADIAVVALGSVIGTIKDAVDDLRQKGLKVGCLKIVSFRPFPTSQLHAVLKHVKRVIIVEKALALGNGGIVSGEITMALHGLPITVQTVIAGLGGRPILKSSLIKMIRDSYEDHLEPLHFLDIDKAVIQGEMERQKQVRRAGPTPESIIRKVGITST